MPQPHYMDVIYNIIFAGYLLASFFYLGLLVKQNLSWAKLGKAILISTVILQLIFIFLRMVADRNYVGFWYAPLANLFEEATCLTCALSIYYLITESFTGFRTLGTIIVPLNTLLVTWCALGGPGNSAMSYNLEQPPPALRSYWIDIHVPVHLIAYSALVVAFGLGIMYLAKHAQEEKWKQLHRGEDLPVTDHPEEPLSSKGGVAVIERTKKPSASSMQRSAQQTGFLSWAPPSDRIDKMIYRAVVIGFGFLTALIMLGATWAEVSWGTYWGWDPKETSALITWLVYAVYIHGRFMLGWGTKQRSLLAWLCIIGFASLMFTYLGVSFLLPGLHSYLRSLAVLGLKSI